MDNQTLLISHIAEMYDTIGSLCFHYVFVSLLPYSFSCRINIIDGVILHSIKLRFMIDHCCNVIFECSLKPLKSPWHFSYIELHFISLYCYRRMYISIVIYMYYPAKCLNSCINYVITIVAAK